jgi:enamine deaminase RidA (YjgF/YER057c/UK114 family)
MTPGERLLEMGIELPDLPRPLGSYLPCVQSGDLLFVSGMLPLRDGKLMAVGKVGADVSPEDARACARQAAVGALAVVAGHLGGTDGLARVARVVQLTAFVASSPEFMAQPSVANGASDLMAEVFGERGRHARAAVGVPVLPLDSPVEIAFVFELTPDEGP